MQHWALCLPNDSWLLSSSHTPIILMSAGTSHLTLLSRLSCSRPLCNTTCSAQRRTNLGLPKTRWWLDEPQGGASLLLTTPQQPEPVRTLTGHISPLASKTRSDWPNTVVGGFKVHSSGSPSCRVTQTASTRGSSRLCMCTCAQECARYGNA